jgi:uncharacterized membrane protein
MFGLVIFALTFAAAIGSGLVAGIFFAFSSFVMAALGRLPPKHGIAAMQSINVTVLNPVFMLAFAGTGVLCLALAAGSYFWWDHAGGKLVLIASVIYVAGCIGVTKFFNVPLNDALAAVQAGAPEAANLWSRYLAEWTAWNTVRTVASLASAILLTAALIWSLIAAPATGS